MKTTTTKNWLPILLILCHIFCVAKCEINDLIKNGDHSDNGDHDQNHESNREGKIFSVFSLVQFKNTPCLSNSAFTKGIVGYRNGTCFTSVECSEKGGLSAGTCASGFGVCCVFSTSTSGSTSSSNCTYIRNPSFPSALTTTSSITYTIAKCVCNVCYLRLDFDCFTIQGTANTLETGGGVCLDSFTVTNNVGPNIPTICGQNTGQHLYIDTGAACTDTVSLNFAFTGSSTTRTWEIKVTQIPCGSPAAPPNGCLQYQTALTGTITTFNFIPTNNNKLKNQNYAVCIRQDSGYCCIEYTVCPGVANAFSINSGNAITGAMLDTQCTTDYIQIQQSSGTCNQNAAGNAMFNNKYCGSNLNTFDLGTTNIPICDCTAPFMLQVVTDATAQAIATKSNRGLCLDYTQIPCSN